MFDEKSRFCLQTDYCHKRFEEILELDFVPRLSRKLLQRKVCAEVASDNNADFYIFIRRLITAWKYRNGIHKTYIHLFWKDSKIPVLIHGQ